VHHGGAGTTSASLRAGVPTLILWIAFDQTIWASAVKRLGVGTSRRFSKMTRESLVADLRRIIAPAYAARAREVSCRMTKPRASADFQPFDLRRPDKLVRHVPEDQRRQPGA